MENLTEKEHKGKQELFLEANTEELSTLLHLRQRTNSPHF